MRAVLASPQALNETLEQKKSSDFVDCFPHVLSFSGLA